ncbi:MAG TPA: hypothetical protein VGM56_02885, partial [Byssovorax sp.]
MQVAPELTAPSPGADARALGIRPGARDAAVVARWLVGLRWAVFSLLALALPLGPAFGFEVVWWVAAPALSLVVIVNLVARRRLARGLASEREVALGVAFDLALLTVVLGASGGAANPFSALFFVHVALAASLLGPRTTFLLSGLAACLFAALYVLPVTRACCAPEAASGAFGNHLYGMWAAFVLAAALVAFVLTRVRGALGERQREIEALREREDRNARFAALGTLAAGTAHELATPLGTIAVLAGELERADADALRAHAATIHAQVARCRDVITKMQAGARTAAPAETQVTGVVERAVVAWRAAHPDAEVVVDDARARGAVVALAEGDLEPAADGLDERAHEEEAEAHPLARLLRRQERLAEASRELGRDALA